jgi:two-component sensor histidine kinase
VSAAPPDDHRTLDHALILAPYRRDADYLARLLADHEIRVDIGADAVLENSLASWPGMLLATHEALTPAVLRTVAAHLSAQPSWSEMPIIILLDRASHHEKLRTELSRAWPRARLMFYQRPVASVELVSGVQSALLARIRQRDVRDHIDREIELRHELNHRVKNILASVTSIFEMTRRGATSIDAFADDFRGRLGALDKVHSAVFHAAEDIVSLDTIAGLTFDPYRVDGVDRIVVDGPDIMLSREAGTTLALCLHELATNAIKYGALSIPDGQVRFTWTISQEPMPELVVLWRESDGPPVVEPARIGYGTRYVRSALGSLFGQKPVVTFAADGLVCEARGLLSRLSGNQ